MKSAIKEECQRNIWYFLREVVRVRVEGEIKQFKLTRNGLAMIYCAMNDLTTHNVSPRQTHRTVTATAMLLSTIIRSRTPHDISLNDRMNYKRLKDMNDLLPDYLRVDFGNTINGTRIKENHTKVSVLNSIQSEKHAENIARGLDANIHFFDNIEYMEYNETVIEVSTPAYLTQKMLGTGYRIFSSVPGDLSTKEGKYFDKLIKEMAIWNESLYDLSPTELRKYVKSNSTNNMMYIEYNGKSLGLNNKDIETMCRIFNFDHDLIAREVFLKRF